PGVSEVLECRRLAWVRGCSSRLVEPTPPGHGRLPEAAIRPTSEHPNTCMLFCGRSDRLGGPVWRSSCSPGPGLMERGLPMSNRRFNEQGFGMAELIVVVAVIGLLAALAMPSFLSFWQSSSLSAGSAEMASVLNRGRQLAVSQNTSVCVQVSGSNVRFRTV